MNHGIDIHRVFASYFNRNLRALAYAVSKKLNDGHICLDINEYNSEIKGLDKDSLFEINPFLSTDYLEINNLKGAKFITFDSTKKEPLVVNNNKIYLHRYFEYENNIIECIHALIENEKEQLSERKESINKITDYINHIFLTKATDDGGTNWQQVAAITSVLHNFSIITGGPGTGKTSTVAGILAILYTMNPAIRVAIAAPTGKAATRLNESLQAAKSYMPGISDEIKNRFEGIKASTIHRLLKSKKNSPYFYFNANNPLAYDVVIIDETSMADGALSSKLLEAIHPEKKLILLGDKNQLASVEAGSIFGDLCQSATKTNLLSGHITELIKSHRFDNNKGIGLLSQQILNGCMPPINRFINDKSVDIDTSYSSKKFLAEIEQYREYIEEQDIKLSLQKLKNTRTLCALREGEYGVNACNRRIEKHLEKLGLISLDKHFYNHRPIIVTRNDYNLKLFNGDIGIIREDKNKTPIAWFESNDGEIISVIANQLIGYESVFAMTVHKSQGSEFNNVLLILPNNPDINILTRELLYTGITRAKNRISIQSTEATLNACASQKIARASGISSEAFNKTASKK